MVKRTFCLIAALAVAGCGSNDTEHKPPVPPPKPQLFGRGPAYNPPPHGAHERIVHCSNGPRYLAHVEVIANARVVRMPAGIGVHGTCSARIRTRAPTGLIEVAKGTAPTIGAFFRTWGQSLTPNRVLSFPGRVRAYRGTERVTGDPRRIRLTPHASITLEVGPYLRPHARFVFPPYPAVQ